MLAIGSLFPILTSFVLVLFFCIISVIVLSSWWINVLYNNSFIALYYLQQPAWQTCGKKGKVFPYSLSSVGPGADPGAQAVSPQVTWSESRHRPGSRLPLYSARSAVTCVAFLPLALFVNGSTHLIPALLLIYRPRKDERLSWPSWLTCSGRFTHISGHSSAAGRAQDRESSPVIDRRSTTVLRHQAADVWPTCIFLVFLLYV